MLRTSWLVLVALLAFGPIVGAQTTEEQIWPGPVVGEFQSWRVLNQNFESTVAVKTDSFLWERFTGYPKAIDTSVLTVEVSATITTPENSAGVWRYTMEMANGGGMVNLGACFWNHQTFNAGVLGGNLITRTTYIIHCRAEVMVAEDSPINFWINRTVLSGSPPTPIQTHIAILGDRGDFIVTIQPTAFEELTGLTGIEFLAIMGLGAALLIVGTTTRHKPAKSVSASMVVLLAVLLLLFNQSAVVIIMAAALGLGASTVLFFLFLERLKEGQSRGPRRFFE